MTDTAFFAGGWWLALTVLGVALSIVATAHVLLYKRDTRSAVAWLGFIWLAPIAGPILYSLLGVNRIKRRAALLRGALSRYTAEHSVAPCPPARVVDHVPADAAHMAGLATVVSTVATRPLVPGNRVEPLVNGDAAYPEMLAAIRSATQSVALSTYIFDRDVVGLEFTVALGDAVRRGVEVRVLIDATGSRYSWPSILAALRNEGVPYARHLPLFPFTKLPSMNLRNHRKILVVDGTLGFTGGMNIRVGHWLARNPSHPVRDIQFRIAGPVVAQMQEVFTDDWRFSSGEELRGGAWFPALEPAGNTLARGISDGPDEDMDKLRWTLLAALSVSRRSIRILTPYFLPDPALVSAMNVAAMRGVAVHIVVPEKNNLPFVHWASVAQWWQVLEHGCRIWLSPPPFDHSKMFIVDDCWALVGTTNWDPRSLRLNFEFNIECYDPALGRTLAHLFDERLATGREVTLEEVDGRSVPVRLRDGAARLFTPFL